MMNEGDDHGDSDGDDEMDDDHDGDDNTDGVGDGDNDGDDDGDSDGDEEHGPGVVSFIRRSCPRLGHLCQNLATSEPLLCQIQQQCILGLCTKFQKLEGHLLPVKVCTAPPLGFSKLCLCST